MSENKDFFPCRANPYSEGFCREIGECYFESVIKNQMADGNIGGEVSGKDWRKRLSDVLEKYIEREEEKKAPGVEGLKRLLSEFQGENEGE